MESQLFTDIADFLISICFSRPNGTLKVFRCKLRAPGRVVIVNGRRMEEPDREVDFDIKPLGMGSILDIDNVPTQELQGFNIGSNDIWVDSLEDFKFWLDKLTHTNDIVLAK